MKVVHINYVDHYGGAAIAARRLHLAMRRAGHDSRMLVWSKYTDDPTIDLFERRAFWRGLSQLVGRRLDGLGLQYLFHPTSRHLLDHPWIAEADIVNLHQIHGSYFSLPLLPRLSKQKPLFWTMHDLWAVTGHCAIAAYHRCDRWQTGCGQCLYKDYYPAVRWDLSHMMWQLKKKIYRRSRFDVIAPSQWMAEQLKLSPLLMSRAVHHIANGVDLKIFHPIPKETARVALGIQPDKKVLMFGAASLSEPDKGGHLLMEALSTLPLTIKRSLKVLLVGSRNEAIVEYLTDLDIMALGPVYHETLLALAYAAADLFVLPSLAENLPNMLVESLACGTPCVAFDVGGCSEIITHNHTGYLARPGDAEDLALGIQVLLSDEQLSQEVAQACRSKADQFFNVDRQAGEYLQLYEKRLAHSA